MKALKLVFLKKTTVETDDGPAVSMELRGRWENNENLPKVTLRITECDEESASNILEALDIDVPGETVFFKKGINPQVKLDDFFAKAEKRRTSQIDNFTKEIEDFDEELLRERYDLLTTKLDALITEEKTETKVFDFYFECLQVVYEKAFDSDFEFDKATYIQNHTIAAAISPIGGSEDVEPEDEFDDWPNEEPEEEE